MTCERCEKAPARREVTLVAGRARLTKCLCERCEKSERTRLERSVYRDAYHLERGRDVEAVETSASTVVMVNASPAALNDPMVREAISREVDARLSDLNAPVLR